MLAWIRDIPEDLLTVQTVYLQLVPTFTYFIAPFWTLVQYVFYYKLENDLNWKHSQEW